MEDLKRGNEADMSNTGSLGESLFEVLNIGFSGLTDRLSSSGPSTRRWKQGASDPSRAVVVDGVSLAYDDEGQGEPLVCLHAIAHGARDFEEVRRRFAKDYRVIALDWPGQGRSGADHEPASLVRYSELLEGFLNALGIERAVLIGNSIGGGAALRFAAKHPERVRALVLENPAGLSPMDARAKRFVKGMSRFFDAGAKGAPWFPLAFGAFYQLMLPLPAARAHRRRIARAGRECAGILAEGWASFASEASDLGGMVGQVATPTLFAWAVRDKLNALSRARKVIERMPNAKIEKVDAGHCPHMERPDDFERTVRAFLAQLPSTARFAS